MKDHKSGDRLGLDESEQYAATGAAPYSCTQGQNFLVLESPTNSRVPLATLWAYAI